MEKVQASVSIYHALAMPLRGCVSLEPSLQVPYFNWGFMLFLHVFKWIVYDEIFYESFLLHIRDIWGWEKTKLLSANFSLRTWEKIQLLEKATGLESV